METTPVNAKPQMDKVPTTLMINHDDVPELKDCAPGDHVSFQVSGVVKGNRGGDQYSHGQVDVELDDIKFLGDETPEADESEVDEPEIVDNPTEEEAEKLPVKELRKRLPVKKEY